MDNLAKKIKWDIFPVVVCIMAIATLGAPHLYAKYSALDKKNKQALEQEAADLRKEMKTAKLELEKEKGAEWDAYMKETKGEGTSRAEKINTARNLYDITQKRKETSGEYNNLKKKYDDLNVKLKQTEWELQHLGESQT